MLRINPSVRPIGDYGIIGDCHSAALISKAGSLDWLCLPRFDSPAAFFAILDPEKGGSFTIQPVGEFESRQSYIEETNVLQTIFKTPEGRLSLTDLMPVSSENSGRLLPRAHILRKIECLEGAVELLVDFRPRPDFGRAAPRLEKRGALGIFVDRGGQVINLVTDLELGVSDGSAFGRISLSAGEVHYISLAFTDGEPAVIPVHGDEAGRSVEETINWWSKWAGRSNYKGPYRDAVIRSALALKLLAYAPSGAIVAAPTASLPESPGGGRNWDYRFCWLRDASMTLHAFYKLGYTEEAQAFLSWLIHSTRLTWPELKVLYTVYGESTAKEEELDSLAGYAGSRPVRIGNEASNQFQLDIYGEIVDGAFAFTQWGKGIDRPTGKLLAGFGDFVVKHWREPDLGIWEIRGEPRHFTFSKVMCWVALDRLLKMHESKHIKIAYDKLLRERDAIRSEIEARGYNEKVQSYTVSFSEEDVDISLLLLPVFGYVDPNHPRMRSTYKRIEEQLGRNGLLLRYRPEYDGIPDREGAFAAGSFWAVQYLAARGRKADAHAAFRHLLSFANHLGLYGEEIEPQTGKVLGNFPQAYTHVGLINSALKLAEADDGGDGDLGE